MNRRNLATLALGNAGSVARMIREGSIGLDAAWMVMRGGLAYARAIATGDITPEHDEALRSETCDACPIMTTTSDDVDTDGGPRVVVRRWCGVPLQDRTDEGAGCGCNVDGMIMVASKSCPRGHWAAVTVGAT